MKRFRFVAKAEFMTIIHFTRKLAGSYWSIGWFLLLAGSMPVSAGVYYTVGGNAIHTTNQWNNNIIWSTTPGGSNCNCTPDYSSDTFYITRNVDFRAFNSSGGLYIVESGGAIEPQWGTMTVGSGMQIIVESGGELGPATNGISNYGYIQIDSGASWTQSGGSLYNDGTILIYGDFDVTVNFTNDDSGTVTINGSFDLTGGQMNNDGAFNIGSEGSFYSTTTVNNNTGGNINIGGDYQQNGGSLNNNGNTNIDTSGSLNMNNSGLNGGSGGSITNNGNMDLGSGVGVNNDNPINGTGNINLGGNQSGGFTGPINGCTGCNLNNGTNNNLGNTSAPMEWVGNTDDWSALSNWSLNALPVSSSSISIPANPSGGNLPRLSGNVVLNRLNLEAGASIELNGHQLTIKDTLSGTGLIIGSTSSSLVIEGATSRPDTLRMDQSSSSTKSLKRLTVNKSSTLVLADDLIIHDVLTLTNGILNSSGKLKLAAASPSNYARVNMNGNGDISGNFTYEKVLSNTDEGWRLMSLPINASLSDLSGMTILGSGHSTPGERNVYYWDASEDGSSGNAKGWVTPSSGGGNDKAYFIFNSNSNGFHDFSTQLNITGEFFKDSISVSLYDFYDPASSPSGSSQGWNLIPNPYPSNLDITALLNGAFGNLSYKAVHIWDLNSGQYKAVTASGVTQYNTSGSALSTNVIIPPFQPIWVKANGSGTFTIKKDYCTTDTQSLAVMMKKSPELLRLQIQDNQALTDELVIYFHASASEGLDNGLDAFKLPSLKADAPFLASHTEDGDLTINALQEGYNDYFIPLTFKSTEKGSKTFKIDASAFNNTFEVFLVDKKANKEFNLRDQDYQFLWNDQDKPDRFMLKLKKKLASIPAETKPNELIEVTSIPGKALLIQSNELQGKTTLKVYGLDGQSVQEFELNARLTKQVVSMDHLPTGVYIAVIERGEEMIYRELISNQ